MGVKTKRVRVVQDILTCDDCDGTMEKTGRMFTTYPETFEYKCNMCGRVVTSQISYPKIRYVEDPLIRLT